MGRATLAINPAAWSASFQSTPSVGRATSQVFMRLAKPLNFNPRPPWGGRRGVSMNNEAVKTISIHALRGEGDRIRGQGRVALGLFQSTPSVGRATNADFYFGRGNFDFNPRPPWGGRHDGVYQYPAVLTDISIHALRGEGDSMPFSLQSNTTFQSTPSVGRATLVCKRLFGMSVFQSTPSVGRATDFQKEK